MLIGTLPAPSSPSLRRLCFFLLVALFVVRANAYTYQWTNTLGGDWAGVLNWSPNGTPGTNDVASITAPGTYTITATNNTAFWGLILGATSGTQTLFLNASSASVLSNYCVVNANGVLVATNAGLEGNLTIAAGGQFQVAGAPSKNFYDFTLVNQGTVTLSGGGLNFGGTTISNGGLWLITGDTTINNGGGATPVWINSGILRKSGGTASTTISGLTFLNAPGGLVDVLAGTLKFSGAGTNVISGTFSATAPATLSFVGGVWTDGGGSASGTGTNQFAGGTLLLQTNLIPGLALVGGDIYTTGTFQQAGAITNLTLDGANLRGTNTVNHGTLTVNSGAILDQLTIQSAGQLLLATPAGKFLYSSSIVNFGTVTWSGGTLITGGNSIANGGLWQIAGDLLLGYGGTGTPIWNNSGILRKTAGSGVAQLAYVNFTNQAGGLVDAQSGTIQFAGGTGSQLGGTFNAAATGLIDIPGGTWTDAGGTATGAGTNRLSNGGIFNFRTNTIPGLQLIGGNIYVTGTNTFQQAGAITNLTLDGAALAGTNFIGAGTLTVNSGSVAGQLTVQTGGQLLLTTTTGKYLYGLNLINQGSVLWNGGSLYLSATVVSNGGWWQMTSDSVMSFGGGAVPVWTNSGTLIKTAGTGISSVASFSFYNQPNGLVQVNSGTLQLTSVTTNLAGEWRLNGGTLLAAGTLAFSGGNLDGTGTVGANALNGGVVSPGLGGAGLLSFSAGLNLGSNATLQVDGTGLVPGVSYDQLSVTGAVALGNCTLQVTALPSVATGATFVLINNDGTDAVVGTFNGLAENAIVPVGNQFFRLSYAGGTGNDVTLTRIADTIAQPRFSSVTRTGRNAVYLAATGIAGLTYTVQACADLTTRNWLKLGTATADAQGNLSFADTGATNYPTGFYRCVWP